jgi:DNA polymerase III delta prime subunit
MTSEKLNKLNKKEYAYPEHEDNNFQNKIYEKREFYYNRIPENRKMNNYDDIKRYRDDVCGGKLSLYRHQSLLSNFINPNTPYKGLLIFHGVGTGKTGTAISIAENFKDIVKKYNTKIYILVPGPLLKENWKDEIIKFTASNYINDLMNQLGYIDEIEESKAKRNSLKDALQYYKIITHRGFYKKVLGEKVKDIRETDDKKNKYRITDDGDIERDISIDKIENLDNSILIVDEVHNFTGNEHGEALKKIIKKSKNCRLLLLSATPMKNLASDIIELINYLRPENDQLKREKIFNNNSNHLMDFKEGGEEYFENMCNGYISYYRGANPLLFAKRVDIGEIPPGLIFTKCIRCKMNKFQKITYDNVAKINIDDTLERSTSSVANIAFPVLSKDKIKIEGSKGEEGINIVKSNLKTNKDIYLKKLNEVFFDGKIKNVEEIVYESMNTESITGLIYKKEYLNLFSTKFYEVLMNINSKVEGKNGSGTIFIYSNLVKVGIEVFQEILLQNGYLEFKEDQNYTIIENTLDYKTGIPFSDFTKKYPKRKFYPATFIRITGKTDETEDELPDAKKRILDNYFNNIENSEGRLLKIILGSRVMNEGITLENTSEVHILDVYYNFGRVEQIIGRAIRQCKHYKVTSEENPYPTVKVYKYVVRMNNDELSSEENLYRKAELKYLLVKKVERSMKKVSIDCPINYNGNVFQDEIKENENCVKPDINSKKNKNIKICPERCDFMNCDYICKDKKLNLKYYDRTSKIYKKISKVNLDYSTFTDELAKNEINSAKDKIKDLFKLKYVYTLREILNLIKSTFKVDQRELFEDWFVYQALDKLIPTQKNEFINFKDTIYDKYNTAGYLIYRGIFYIFQPFEQDENVPMFYRKNYTKELLNQLSLYSYLKSNKLLDSVEKLKEEVKDNLKQEKYDFKSNQEYYDQRDEFDIIGIIDTFSGNRKLTIGKEGDVFKIRNKRDKILDKKRGIGIPSSKGAVCYSSKDKSQLKKIANIVGMKEYNKKNSRIDTCLQIRDRLLYLEKYSTGKDNKTYMIIPFNHPIHIFPFNLEDRVRYVNDKFNELQEQNVKFKFKKTNNGIFLGKRDKKYDSYQVTFSFNGELKTETKNLLKKYNISNKGNIYSTIME